MRIKGKIWKSGKHWIVSCPTLQADTQGTSQKNALRMAEAWVRDMLGDQRYRVKAEMAGAGEFVYSFDDPKPVLALIVHRTRTMAGLTLQEAATRIGKSTRSAVSTYESGKHEPSFSKMAELLEAAGSWLVISVEQQDEDEPKRA